MCIFFVRDGWLLGFIVSKDEIRIDSPNFAEILWLYVPCAITHLYSLQGMVIYYVNLFSIKLVWPRDLCACWRRILHSYGINKPKSPSTLLRNPWHQPPYLVHLTIIGTSCYMFLHVKRWLVWFKIQKMMSSMSMLFIILVEILVMHKIDIVRLRN